MQQPHHPVAHPQLMLARFISILGHPMLVMPMAALLGVQTRGVDAPTTIAILASVVALGIIVLGYCALQVRHGRWQHVDASENNERRSLNVFLLLLFAAGSGLALLCFGPSGLSLALALPAAIILLALMLSRWCKLSLHVAFVSFAAFVPGTLTAAMAFGVLGMAVAWSRLALSRHVRLDLLIGLLAGVCAGVAFHIV